MDHGETLCLRHARQILQPHSFRPEARVLSIHVSELKGFFILTRRRAFDRCGKWQCTIYRYLSVHVVLLGSLFEDSCRSID